MTEDYHPPTKPDLLAVVDTERERFESLLDGLTDSQMTESGVEAAWSIKDILAHIAAWERLAFDRIHAARTGEALKFPLIRGDTDVDAFNSQVYQKNKDLSLTDILAEFRASHRSFRSQIETLDDDFLTSPLPFDWAGKLTARVLISANTHWHYTEHLESITKWLETQ